MNILFVNHNDFLSNSMGHIAGFADLLSAWGHHCIVAVPFNAESAAKLANRMFVPASYADVLGGRITFPDGDAADIIHAWTPRENLRKFVARYDPEGKSRLVVHMEDNEELLLGRWAGVPFATLAAREDRKLARSSTDALSHPRHYRTFLRTADAVTGVTEALGEFVPAPVPFHLLRPGVDFAAYHAGPKDSALWERLGLATGERVLCYTGNLHHANRGDVQALLLTVQLLNARGFPCRLIRTGLPAPDLVSGLAPGAQPYILDLGFVEKSTLPDLLRLADVLVQPGAPDVFNIYRLPSKVPEFLSVGRPVLLPACNIADEMVDGEDALLLRSGSPEEIAGLCIRLFGDAGLAARLSGRAAAAARRLFDPAANAKGLEAVYRSLLASPHRRVRRDTPLAGLASLLLAAGDGGGIPEDLQTDLAREMLLSAPAEAELAPVAEATGIPCRLYEPAATGYEEGRSTTRFVEDGQWQRVRFACGKSDGAGRIRIDPAEEPCIIEVAGLIVRSPLEEGRVLWRARGQELRRLTIAGTARDAGQARTLRAYSFGTDPQLLLPPVEALGIDGPVEIELWIRVSTDLSPLQGKIDAMEALHSDSVQEFQRLTEIAAQEFRRLAEIAAAERDAERTQMQAQIESGRRRVFDLERSFSWRVSAPIRVLSRALRR